MYYELRPSNSGSAALLRIDLPEWTRYRITIPSAVGKEPAFDLGEGFSLHVLTDLRWTFINANLVTETAEYPGRLFLLVESEAATVHVRDVILVAAQGYEREAVIARAALGRGFVPSFVLDKTTEHADLEQILRSCPTCTSVVCVGVEATGDLARQMLAVDQISSSTSVSDQLGYPRPETTVYLPDRSDAFGPALFLALERDAALRISNEVDDEIVWVGREGARLASWRIPELVGSVLRAGNTQRGQNEHGGSPPSVASDSGRELVLCENTPEDLLVCQAVGYAQLGGADIAFLPSIPAAMPQLLAPSDDLADFAAIREAALGAIPAGLRRPAADDLVIFTLTAALHLTPCSESETDGPQLNWSELYSVTHMPRQTASFLVPMVVEGRTQRAVSVPFAVVFDALGDVVETEGDVLSTVFEEMLAHPVLLRNEGARKGVLQAAVETLDVDLLLLATHGSDDFIEDGAGDTISAEELGAWRFRGTPLVFNNSCSSWSTTGEALLRAGARGVIATLWPVPNREAAWIAGEIATAVRSSDDPDVPRILRDTLSRVFGGTPESRRTAAAYVYVGLPRTMLDARPALHDEEHLAMLAHVLMILYERIGELAKRVEPSVAYALHAAVKEALLRRFSALVVPGELPRNLPPPFQSYSVLEAPLLVAMADFAFRQHLIHRFAHEQQDALLEEMEAQLQFVVQETMRWNERHAWHLEGTNPTWADEPDTMGLSRNAISEEMLYAMLVRMAHQYILPFVVLLADMHWWERARSWLQLTRLLVTTPADLEADGTVTDSALQNRIREGIRIRGRVYSPGNEAETEEVWFNYPTGVDTSDLANSFAIAYRHLLEHERARTFFDFARSLAEPGSMREANARSNAGVSVDDLAQALEVQKTLGDYRNAAVTAANLIRHAARTRHPLQEQALDDALALSDLLPEAEGASRKCDVLGAMACYQAAFGNDEATDRVREQLAEFLRSGNPTAAVSINELVQWYVDKGRDAAAARVALANGDLLHRAGFPDVATHTYLQACASALAAYADTGVRKHLGTFLTASGKAGALLRQLPGLRDELSGPADSIFSNTQSIWHQSAQMRDHRLALEAYEAQKHWGSAPVAVWEDLAATFHGRNRDAVQALIALGAISRRATVSISEALRVLLQISTHRKVSSHGFDDVHIPDCVYCYLPLASTSNSARVNGEVVAETAGQIVFRLCSGEQITVEEEDVESLHRLPGESEGYWYGSTWGSDRITYELTIHLAADLIPIRFECRAKTGCAPSATVRFTSSGADVTVRSDCGPWLADMALLFRRAPGATRFFGAVESPFREELPFAVFEQLFRLAATGAP